MVNNRVPVILGAGGPTPGIRAIHSDHPIPSFPRGDSVYRITGSSTGRHVAYATRSGGVGFIEILDGTTFRMVRQLQHRAPVIAACCDDDSFTFSDTEGGCYLCGGSEYFPAPLPREGKDPICALTVAGSEVVGVTTGGTIWVWNEVDTESTRRLEGAPPPQPYACVNAIYVHAWDKLVFPAIGGSLLTVSISSGIVTTVSAHCGEVGAAQEFNGKLITFGRSDGTACLWRDNPLSIEREWKAPRNIVAVALTHDHVAPFLAVNWTGEAFLCRFAGDEITPFGETLSGDFRCCFGFSERACSGFRAYRLDHELRQILDTIAERRASGDLVACEDCFGQLQALGRKDIVLAVKADIAAAVGNLRDEVYYRKSLASSLPDDESSLCTFWNFVHLLVRLHLYQQAHEVCGRIKRIRPSNREADVAIDCLARLNSIVASGSGVVSIENVDGVVDAWDAAADTCDARILLQTFVALDCHGLLLDVGDYLREWELTRRESLCCQLPSASIHSIQIATGWVISEPISAVIHPLNSSKSPGLEFSLLFREEDGQTLVEPVLLFNPLGAGVKDAPAEQNQRIRRAALEVANHGGRGPSAERMLSLAEATLAGVIGEVLSEARRKKTS